MRGLTPAVLSRHSAVAILGKVYVFGGCIRYPSGGKAKLRYSSRLYTLTAKGHGLGDQPAVEAAQCVGTQRRQLAADSKGGGGEGCVRVEGCRSEWLLSGKGRTDGREGRTGGGSEGSSDHSDAAGLLGLEVSWEPVEAAGKQPAARAEHAATGAGTKMYIFGGQRLSRPKSAGREGSVSARVCNELFILDVPTLTWSQVGKTPPLRREGCSLVPLGGTFLVSFGGWSGSYAKADSKISPWSAALHVLHLPSMQWFQLDAPGAQPAGRYGHAAAILDLSETDANRSVVECGWRGDVVAGSVVQLIINARDERGNVRLGGGDSFNVTLTQRGSGSLAVEAQLVDGADGTYIARLRPTVAAEYDLRVQLMHSRSIDATAEGTVEAVSDVPILNFNPVVRVCAAECHGMAAHLHSHDAVDGVPLAPLSLIAVDAYGNHARHTSLRPHVRLGSVSPLANSLNSSQSQPSPDVQIEARVCDPERGPQLTPHVATAPSRAVSSGSEGGLPARDGPIDPSSGGECAIASSSLVLTLRGVAALVTVIISDEDSELGSVEVPLRLTGIVCALHASVTSGGAVSGFLFGPVRVSAVDREGNAVGDAAFRPTLRGERAASSCEEVTRVGCDMDGDGGSNECRCGGDDGRVESRGAAAAWREHTPDRVVIRVVESRWEREAAHEPLVALLWLKIEGEIGDMILYVDDGGVEDGAEGSRAEGDTVQVYAAKDGGSEDVGAECGEAEGGGAGVKKRTSCLANSVSVVAGGLQGTKVPLYLTGPPYFLRANWPGGELVAGEESAPLILRLVDKHGKHVSGLHFDPKLSVALAEADGCTVPTCSDEGTHPVSQITRSSNEDPVSGMADTPWQNDTSLRCDMKPVRWQRSSGGAKQAAVVNFCVRGRADRCTIQIQDRSGLGSLPLLVPFSLRAGSTVPEACELDDPLLLTTLLMAGESRSLRVRCVDAYANPAVGGRDVVALVLSGSSSLPAVHASCESALGGWHTLTWCATTAGKYVPWLTCNGSRLLIGSAGGSPPTLLVHPGHPSALRLHPVSAGPGFGWTDRSWPSFAPGAPVAPIPLGVQVELGRQLLLHVHSTDRFGNTCPTGVSRSPRSPILRASVSPIPVEHTNPHYSDDLSGLRDRPCTPSTLPEISGLSCKPVAPGHIGDHEGVAMRVAIAGRAGPAALRVHDSSGLEGFLDIVLLPGQPAAAMCEAVGTGVQHAVAGERAGVRLLLRDAWHNLTTPTLQTQPPRLVADTFDEVDSLAEARATGTLPVEEVEAPRVPAKGALLAHRSVKLQAAADNCKVTYCHLHIVRYMLLTAHPSPLNCSSLTDHRSPLTPDCPLLTAHRSLLAAHRSPLTAYRAPLTTHRSPLTAHRSLRIAHCSPLTVHCSLLTAHCSLLTAYCSLSGGRQLSHGVRTVARW